MRLPCLISFVILVNCLDIFQSAFGKDEKPAGKRGEKQTFARSGQFLTKHRHECTWEIVGDLTVSLSLSCDDKVNSSYRCSYEGEPHKCPSYSLKAKQYWKQILGKFKKSKNVCEEKSLKSRICKKAAAVESQLVRVDGDAVDDRLIDNSKAKGKSRSKDSRKGPEESPSTPDINENVGAEKKSNKKTRKPSTTFSKEADPSSPPSVPDLIPTARAVNDDIVELNEDLAETYCSENWQSMCSFFVNFWNG
ncbi:fibroblast growth factor-binding protein 3 [Spea bombifrons]|uniref:fibroblast growth factor-binding protein 3 n=1 Tax=Spea bombifrons TaxID=233779 RepID=UPI002349D370|nr:fibroblast growth factor-binding protein 3 [Spea bombifrons]